MAHIYLTCHMAVTRTPPPLWLWPKWQWQLWKALYLCCFRLDLWGLCTPRWRRRAQRGGRRPPPSAACSASQQTTSCLLQHTHTDTKTLIHIFEPAGKRFIIKYAPITRADLWCWAANVRVESHRMIFLPRRIILISTITRFSPIWAPTV